MEQPRDYLAEKAPGVVAMIGIVYAREGNADVLAAMPESFEPVTIRADDVSDLALKLSRYALDATISAGDPGPNRIRVALDVAVDSGATREQAAAGAMRDRRDR